MQIVDHGHFLVKRIVLRKIAYILFDLFRILPDGITPHADIPFIGHEVTGDRFHGGGLSGPVWSKESHNLPGFYRERYIIHGFLVPEFLGNVLNDDIHRTGSLKTIKTFSSAFKTEHKKNKITLILIIF